MDPVANLKATATTMEQLLANIDDEQMSLPTPCALWSVADLTGHVVDNLLNSFAHWAGVDAEPETGELSKRYTAAIDTVLDAYTAPGVLDKTLSTMIGDFPGAALLAVCFADQLTHVWDLARATGQTVDVPDQLAEEAIEVWRGFIPDALRNGSAFGVAIGTGQGASALDRLAAFTGRAI